MAGRCLGRMDSVRTGNLRQGERKTFSVALGRFPLAKSIQLYSVHRPDCTQSYELPRGFHYGLLAES
jgi:hypothetical protein